MQISQHALEAWGTDARALPNYFCQGKLDLVSSPASPQQKRSADLSHELQLGLAVSLVAEPAQTRQNVVFP